MLIMLSLTWHPSSSNSLTFHVVWKFLLCPMRHPSPNFRSHLGMPHALSKWDPCLISLIPGGDVKVQPFLVHRAEEERKFSSSPGFGFGFSPFFRRQWSTARSQPESRNSSLSLIETIWLASLSCKKTRWAWWQILSAWRQVFLSHLTARGRKLICYPLYSHTPGKGVADLLKRRCRMGSCTQREGSAERPLSQSICPLGFGVLWSVNTPERNNNNKKSMMESYIMDLRF